MPEQGFDQIAAELYALPPGDFIASRDERSRAARSAGDKELAGRVAALRRPTVSAWVLNLLVRDQPELLDQLLSLGADLREAQRTLQGQALRELASQRQRIVAELVRAARRVAADAGHPVGTDTAYEVEQTLHAALADDAVAQEVGAGRLTKAITAAGGDFEARPRLTAVPAPPKPAKQSAPTKAAARAGGTPTAEEARAARREAERERLDAEKAAVEEDLAAAAEEMERAERVATGAEQAQTDAEELVERLTEELSAARRAVRDGSAAVSKAHRDRDAAARNQESLTRRLADLTRRLEAL